MQMFTRLSVYGLGLLAVVAIAGCAGSQPLRGEAPQATGGASSFGVPGRVSSPTLGMPGTSSVPAPLANREGTVPLQRTPPAPPAAAPPRSAPVARPTPATSHAPQPQAQQFEELESLD